MSPNPILVVEDNPDDLFFMKRSLAAAGLSNPLQVAEDGQTAIDYLSGEGAFSDRSQFPIPLLIFLDLKLPRKDGHEVLSWIRAQPGVRTLVVIMLTTSRESRDITRAYELGCNAYIVKPATPPELVETLRALKSFWLDRNAFPEPVGL